ncbi:hypothetical protein COU14_01525 [Candidatus Kaiserbacteria bacterium CG10_big_fil_rev_8_21_14_0_10_44_10]|uniref:Glycosyl transferase family 1 domain-containing protein n=1 Tax=Candidatus Kaiserbacteria bacterium CG10_big_fil_rev_8_21_14_0_10_44_10 TaxID=1974606 RepID=A0A2H0UHQ9_9BACT|nr:MAG: hypothetical protein COU14_01525 [Candidatus Kaiserbacteria bacterium CG10_big_fil_rev_8_21_14_0_10_44_10]
MLSIYTRSTSKFSKEFWKWAARKITRKYSGPNAVEDSLLRGLKELNIPFSRNCLTSDTGTVVVLSGTEALRENILHKKKGLIKKLIAGPNIVAHPLDCNGILLNKEIDVILVPSQWVADLYMQVVPEIANKIKVWPAGVPISKASSRTSKPIIYDKLGDVSLLIKIQEVLAVPATVFSYGSFNQKDYLEALSEAPYLIYLAKSESQGLALQEAWAHDVPTLVNKSTHWEANDLSWDSPQINCPYLTPELGAIFENVEELPIMIEQVSSLHPKKYCDKYLSDRASAQKLLNLI